MENKPIYVTKPALPPLHEYMDLLEGVWERGILTHNGPLVQQFEKDFDQVCHTRNLVAVSNGTIALQMAIRALGLKGEIITTPFTWVATISAIIWEYCTPVFADIDPHTLNIDPSKIAEKISPRTCAIMPVHVFGNACDTQAIESIAQAHDIKVIYDAAHAVGVMYQGKSLLEYGDITATSFHATKLLNTAEGGGCVSLDHELFEKLRRIRFFGHNDQKDIVEDGFNGKMTEVNAALGLVNLKYLPQVLADRKKKYQLYLDLLKPYEQLQFQSIQQDACNYSYFPVIFSSEDHLLSVEHELNKQQIYGRRYFYPAVNTFTNIVDYEPQPIAEDIAKRIFCLPLYYDLSEQQIQHIAHIVTQTVAV